MTHAHKTKKKAPPASEGTLRDTFAAAVLSALCHDTMDAGSAADVAARAYVLADAMLVAREEQHEPEPAPEA